MVSVLFFAGEVIFTALLLFACKIFLKDTVGKIATPVLAVILIACLFLSNSWVQKYPIVYDDVGIVALNEKNQASGGSEISVQGVECRRIKQEFPTVADGQWFFTTEENYMWRPPTDERQPEGTTQSIVMKIPVGTDRTLLFKKSDWGGKALVGFKNETTQVDTYLQSELKLEDSGIRRQLLQAAGRLSLFAVFMCAFTALIYLLCRISRSNNEKLKQKTVYAGVALAFFVLTFSYLETQELWLDEIFQIGFSGTGKSLYETLMVTETTPPLFRLIANVWYNIVPYGEEWLLLLPTLLCTGFVYVSGLLGEEIGGKYVGYTSAVLAAVSTALLNNGVREFRANALLALLSCVFMLYYIKRQKTGKYAVVMTVMMALLAYTHYFGVFLCGAAFLLDVYYFFTKKRKLKDFVPYVIAGVLFIPWIFRFLELGQLEFEAEWQFAPTFKALYDLLIYLCGDVTFIVLLVVGIVSVALRKKQDEKAFDTRFSLIFIAFTMIVCLYAYGTFIRPQATLWTHRYFLNILPCVLAVIAYGMVQVGRYILAAAKHAPQFRSAVLFKRVACVLLPIYLLASCMPRIAAAYSPTGKQDYKGAAETIYGHADAYCEDSIVVMLTQDYVVDGWYEYYMTMQGKRADIDYASMTKVPTDKQAVQEFFEPYETVYFCYLQEYTNPAFNQLMNEQYKLVKTDNSTCVRVYKRID